MKNKFRAVILCGSVLLTSYHETEKAAVQWIENNNNNMEWTSYVQELDSDHKIKDSFYYTTAKE